MTGTRGLHRGIVDPATPAYRWWLLFVTSIGALLASLNSGTLVIALPEILRDLHTDLFSLLWIVVGYTLVVTVLVLNAGRFAIDTAGPGPTPWASSSSPLPRCGARSPLRPCC